MACGTAMVSAETVYPGARNIDKKGTPNSEFQIAFPNGSKLQYDSVNDKLKVTDKNGTLTKVQVATPTADADVATKKYVDDNAGGSVTAGDVTTTVTGFNNNLSATDDTVQKALDTIDNIDLKVAGITSGSIAGANITVGTGKTLNISDGTLTLADDQISGDKITGGTIGSITISQLAGAMDANSQNVTNLNVDSGTVDGCNITVGADKTLDVSAGTLTLGSGQIAADRVGITATGFTGNLHATDTDLQTMANTIDGLSIPSGTALGTSVDVANFAGNLTSSETDVQKALDKIDNIVIPAGDTFNLETMTGNIALDNTSASVQMLNPNGTDREVSLATTGVADGKKIKIINTADYDTAKFIEVKAPGHADYIYASDIKEYFFNLASGKWVGSTVGSGGTLNTVSGINVNIGKDSKGYNFSTSIGNNSNGSNYGAAIGKTTIATGYSFAGGTQAHANGSTASRYNIAIGGGAYTASGSDTKSTKACFTTDTSNRAIGIGHDVYINADDAIVVGSFGKAQKKKALVLGGVYTYATRYGEQKTSSSDDNKFSRSTVTFYKVTANATPVEAFLDNSAERLTIEASSTVVFSALISARDNVAGHAAGYKIEGVIKRDAANNTAIVGTPNVTVLAEDDAAWDVAFTADDTNEALILTVTGDDTNPTQVQAVVNLSETRF